MSNTALMDTIIMIIFFLTAIVSSLFFSYFAFRAKKSRLLNSFIVLHFLQVLWLLAKILRMLAPTLTLSWYAALVQYISVCFLGASYLNFAYHYCMGKRLHLSIRYLIFAVAFINYMAFATNPIHHQFFLIYDPNNSVRGLFFWVHTISSYSMLVVGYYFMFKGFHKKVLKQIGIQKYLVYAGLVIPFAINIGMQVGLLPLNIDLTPLMFNLIYLVFGFMIYRYQFLDISHIAKTDIYAHMQEGILVFDHERRLESVNEIVYSVLGDHIGIHEFMHFNEMKVLFEGYIEDLEMHVNAVETFMDLEDTHTELDIGIKQNGAIRYYHIDIYKADIGKGKLIIRAFGINRYITAITKLEDQTTNLEEIHSNLSEEFAVKKKLAVAKERNRVSREVHDILGHSLTVVISLIEASKLVLLKDKGMAREKLNMAMKSTRYNLNNLKKSLSNPDSGEMNSDELFSEINKLVRSVNEAGPHVELITRGSSRKLSAAYYDTLYHTCQEGMTNAIRHGHAKEITIAIRFNQNIVDLLIVDNGDGILSVIKGNGLSQIEKKVKDFKGYFSCGSPGGEGFSLHIQLPLVNSIHEE